MNGNRYVPGLTPDAIAERRTWQYKAVLHTRGNTTQLGAFIVAMLGRKSKPPCFSPAGIVISNDGSVLALYAKDILSGFGIARVYESVEDMNKAFRQLADELKLSEAETLAMFEELRKFVRKDERAVSQL